MRIKKKNLNNGTLKETDSDSKKKIEVARGEIVARACEDMLSRSKVGKEMFNSLSNKEQKTLVEKIKDIIQNLKDWVSEALGLYENASRQDEAKILRKYQEECDRLSKLWDEMLAESVEVNQALEKSGAFGHDNNVEGDVLKQARKIDKKRKTIYNEYQTNALIWARATDTQPGDVNILNANGKYFALIEATEDGFIELTKGTYEEVQARYERAYRKAVDEVYGNTKSFRAEQGRDIWDMQPDEDGRDGSGNNQQIRNQEIQNNITRNNEHLRSGDKGKFGETEITEDEILFAKRDKDMRFSMRKNVEETKDLIAVHNLSEEQLSNVVARGQFAMHSIAVTNKSHTAFGDISVVFRKDTINPDISAENKLYGSDAWTPTQTRLKKNPVFNNNEVSNILKDVKRTIGTGFSQIFDISKSEFQNIVTKSDGSIYDALSHNIGMQTAYALKNNLITKVPRVNGRIDVNTLKEQLDAKLDNDTTWRNYKRWLGEISDTVITSYDTATNEDILNNMKQQPDSAKRFKLGENGELTVPSVEYNSLEDYKSNKHRLSEDADVKTEVVGQNFIEWASKVQTDKDVTIRDVINAINSSFDSRYSSNDIISTFTEKGIDLTRAEANSLQALYKQAVELPTRYFEAKPQRAVGLEEVDMIVLPDSASAELKGLLEENNITFTEYANGDNNARLDALNSLDEVRFSKRDREDGTTSEKDSNNQKRITTNMSEDERYEILKDKQIAIARVDSKLCEKYLKEMPGILDKSLSMQEGKKLFKKLGDEFGIFKEYDNEDIGVKFEFGSNNLRESVQNQKGNYELFAQMLSCFSEVISNAVGIDVHNRNDEGYKPDKTLKRVYVLCSAFENDTEIVPVKLSVKEFTDKNNRLYLAVALEGIKKDRVRSMGVQDNLTHIRTSPVTISIAELFKNVNIKDTNFLKYIPNQFISEVQIEAKEKALGIDKTMKTDKIKLSKRDTKSIYDTMGETERIKKENEKLKADVERLNERLKLEKQVTHGNVLNDSHILKAAGHLRNISNSNIDKVQLAKSLKSLYTFIAQSENLTWEEVYERSYRIAESILEESKPEIMVDDYSKMIYLIDIAQ